MEQKLYYSKIQFSEYFAGKIVSIMLLDLPQKELSYQVFRSRIYSDDKSIGIKITEKQINKLLPYCEVSNFEPYRNKIMSMSDIGFCGYRDEISMTFEAITDSYIPKIKLPMDYFYDDTNIWPSEKLYRYLVLNFFKQDENKKLRGWGPTYGQYSLLTK